MLQVDHPRLLAAFIAALIIIAILVILTLGALAAAQTICHDAGFARGGMYGFFSDYRCIPYVTPVPIEGIVAPR